MYFIFDTNLIKFGFTAKSQSTQRTASYLLALKITPKLLKREFFSKTDAHIKNNLHRLDDSHDT